MKFFLNNVLPEPPADPGLASMLTVGAVLLSLLSLGCEDPTIGILSGSVLVDGESAKTGSIAFFPVDGKSFTAGGVIEDGQYTARVPLGESRVEIRIPKVVGEERLYDTPDSPTQPLLEEALPARYNDQSTLRITVESGEKKLNFEVSTK